jgi:hypothetical protein
MTLLNVKKRIRRDVGRFAGRWVALVGDTVLDSAPTLPELVAKIKRRKTSGKPSIMLVPRKDEGPYILIAL